MAIKKVGGRPPIPPTGSTGEVSKSTPVGFGEVAATTGTAQAAPDDVEIAVRSVVGEISDGRLTTPQERVDAVIERLVEAQAPKGAPPKVVRARVVEVQLALGDHPGFTARVHRLIDRALAGAD